LHPFAVEVVAGVFVSINEVGISPIHFPALMLAKIGIESQFSLESVRKLRADFLLLMKNADRVSNWTEAKRFHTATLVFQDHLEHIVYKGVLPPLRKQFGDRFTISDVAKKVWALVVELKAPLMDPQHEPDRPWVTYEWAFEDYLKKKDKWLSRVKAKARAAWTALDEVFEYLTANEPVVMSLPDSEQVDMHGFHVTIHGANETKTRYIQRISDSLRLFRKQASRVFPWILHHTPRITIEFADDLGGNAGLYGANHVRLSGYWSATPQPEKGAQIIAHEMGHHVYEAYLSDHDKDFWSAAVSADYGELDLQTVLDVWPENGGKYWIVDHPLLVTDPVLYLQIYSSMHPPDGQPWFTSKEDVESLMAEGKKTVPVPNNPITVYATKNREEAFCEAFGTYVAYGPRAVPSVVRWWLSQILHTSRTARVVGRFIRCLGSGV